MHPKIPTSRTAPLRLLTFTQSRRVTFCRTISSLLYAVRQDDPVVADRFERTLIRDVAAVLRRYDREGFVPKGGTR